jgi:predicted kinase
MEKIALIIITGLPVTGKTTLGKRLADELDLPFVCKDEIKELLFDGFGWEDREWSKKIGGASYDVLYYIAESILRAGKSLIIETNFNPKFANQKLLELQEKYHFTPVQIRCFADGEVLFERFKARAESTDRHPGHIDGENLDEWRPILLQGKIEALHVGGEALDVDTTDFDKMDYERIVRVIKSAINIKE